MGYEPFFSSSGKANKNENMNNLFKGFPFFRDFADPVLKNPLDSDVPNKISYEKKTTSDC